MADKAKAQAKKDKKAAMAKKAEAAKVVEVVPDAKPAEESATLEPDVITKYRKASEIANLALEHVRSLVKPGASVLALCEAGDKIIEDEVAKVYKKDKKMEKGVAFPTCISPNHIVGHFSPIEDEDMTIKAGDLVTIDLGAQVDGYVAVVATTVCLPEEGQDKITGKKADVMLACQTAADAALRVIKTGRKNAEMTDVIQRSAEAFQVNPVQGVLSHNMSRFVIDGDKVVIGKEDLENKVADFEFAPNDVFAIDIVMTTGEGKPRQSEARTTVYKRNGQSSYQLKMKASRLILTEIDQKCPTFPFTIRKLDPSKVRFGIVECSNHELVHQYPVLTEKEGEFVAHLKFTVLITGNGTLKVSGVDIDTSNVETDKKIEDEELLKVLAQSVGGKKKKKNNKKKKKKKKADE
jgi:curved DNA binding protein